MRHCRDTNKQLEWSCLVLPALTVTWLWTAGAPAFGQTDSDSNFFQLFPEAPTYVRLDRIGLPRSLFFFLEPSPRFGRKHFQMNQLLFREGIAYQPASWIQARVTYDSVFNYNGSASYEQRIGSQLYFERRLGRFSTSYRTRLEQRWFEHVGGVSNRYRHQIAVLYPLPFFPDLSLLCYDELFINLNKTDNGPARGIDTNRIFAGFSKHLKSNINLQIGYRLEYVNRTEVDDQGRHQLWIRLSSAF